LTITVLAAALVGAFAVGTIDRMPPLHLATPFDDAVMDVIRGGLALFLYAVGAVPLGMLADAALTGCGKSRFRDEVIQDIQHEDGTVTLLIGGKKPTRAFFRSLLRRPQRNCEANPRVELLMS